MVQVMESWFLADKSTLARYYGQGFRENVLPGKNVEDVVKHDVYQNLERATRGTQKGAYSKGKHSFDILAKLDPDRVQKASPQARRLLNALRGTVT